MGWKRRRDQMLYVEHSEDNLYMLKMRLELLGDFEVLASPIEFERLVGTIRRRALPAARAEGIYRTFPCRAESSREGQCPAVPSGYEHSLRRACSISRATGRTLALLPSGGSMKGERASDEFFDPTGFSSRGSGRVDSR